MRESAGWFANDGSVGMKLLTARQMISMLNVRGWSFVRQRGSHMVFRKIETGRMIVVPNHPGHTLSTGTQRRIMRDAGITPDEL